MTISDGALVAAATLSDRYISGRQLPDSVVTGFVGGQDASTAKGYKAPKVSVKGHEDEDLATLAPGSGGGEFVRRGRAVRRCSTTGRAAGWR